MDDDLNTAEAMGVLFDLVYDINTELQGSVAREAVLAARQAMDTITGVFGLLTKKTGELPEDVQALAQEREQARKDRDWARSDALRDKLTAMGYTVEDTKLGQKVVKTV